ncbi:MAG: hypothetical protein SWK90_14315 [Chloroflexota bacterium]|nr:hypothetical protein [Chloroflexota bacterium]
MNTAISQTTNDQTQDQEQAVQPAPPLVELLDAPPPVMRRPLALVDGRAYAAAWLYVRLTTTEGWDKDGNIIKHDPPLVETGLRLFVLRDDGLLFGADSAEGDAPLRDLGLDVVLPERPHPSRTWSTLGVKAYRAGKRPHPVSVFNRMADVASRFVDFDRSLADQHTLAEMIACYILATWFLPAFNVIGYPWPSGERGSGKTVLLHTVAEMAYLGQVILAGGSYASLRDLAEYGATLAFDDAENLSDLRKTDPDKRALLLAGNRRGSTITVKELAPDKVWRTRHVNAFCPRLFSAIHLPDNVLASRSIVIPLVRTPDRYRANADPLDYKAWPHDRRQLIDDLWALALAHLPELCQYERAVNDKVRLTGRNLEPWRAILSLALWLDGQDTRGILKRRAEQRSGDGRGDQEQEQTRETSLWQRLETLSVHYQRERLHLESGDLTALVVRALCCCAVRAIDANSANSKETPSDFIITTAQVVQVARAVAKREDGDPDRFTDRRVGRTLGRMRLQKTPRPGGKGSRRWRVTMGDLQRWTAAYGLILPAVMDNPAE